MLNENRFLVTFSCHGKRSISRIYNLFTVKWLSKFIIQSGAVALNRWLENMASSCPKHVAKVTFGAKSRQLYHLNTLKRQRQYAIVNITPAYTDKFR